MLKRVADIIVETLVENDITDCFAVVGGGAMHIDNALALNDKINKYFNHHEQACAMAAEGYAKASGKMAVVSVTSGPGAINTLNGVEGAYVDSVPMIVIAGHPRWDTTVNVTGLKLRCRGVQEFDIIPTVQGMTKYAVMVTNPLEIKKELNKAIKIGNEGRKGPVWISVPLDVQGAQVETDNLVKEEEVSLPEYDLDDKVFDIINSYICNSKRPVILSGSGVRTSGAITDFREFAEKMNIPTLSGSLLADIMYEGEKNFYGTSGVDGERKGNFIIQNADLIIVIGNSLATKQTGFNQEEFAPNAKIIMVDAEKDEMKKPGIHIDYPVFSDVKNFLERANKILIPWKIKKEWIDYCNEIEEILGDIDGVIVDREDDRVPQKYLWEYIRKKLPENGLIALGNSSGIIGGLQKSVRKQNQRVIVNYNSGSMGDDLPEAIGIFAAKKREVLCVTGDGSIMMNLQELQTIKHYGMPIKIIVQSNEGYGGIRQTNKSFFDGRYIGCDKESGISLPDFEKIAQAFEFPYRRCNNIREVEEVITWLFEQPSYAFVEVCQKIDDPISPRLMSRMDENGLFFTPGLQDLYPFVHEELMNQLMRYNRITR